MIISQSLSSEHPWTLQCTDDEWEAIQGLDLDNAEDAGSIPRDDERLTAYEKRVLDGVSDGR